MKTVFHRIDITLVIRRTGDEGALIRIDTPRSSRETRLSESIVRAWLSGGPDAPPTDLVDFLSLTPDSPVWQEWNESRPADGEGTMSVLERLTFDVADLELAALAWEGSLVASLPPAAQSVIVRASPVFPRVNAIPLTLPLRLLQVEPSPDHRPLQEILQGVFGSWPQERVAQAVQVDTCGFAELDAYRVRSNWPTADVLHFDRFPLLDAPASLLTTANPQQPGTLGWLARLVDGWQTRLVVIHCTDAHQAAQARRLATALANRGGPAVLVGHLAPGQSDNFYREFYSQMIHDRPLDAALLQALTIFPGLQRSGLTLVVGAGRSELLRVSSLSEALIALENDLLAAKSLALPTAQHEMRELLARLEMQRPDSLRDPEVALAKIHQTLHQARGQLDKLIYHYHEGDGLLPLSDVLTRMRQLAGWQPPAAVAGGPPVTPAALPVLPRYVNAHLANRLNGQLERLRQKEARLIVGAPYLLGVQIGPQDALVQVYGATALVEEIFKWTPDKTGVWLEVGLTGLNFEVLGEPVQELWLPRDNASEVIYFTVAPQTPDIARLRFCVYYGSDLIQSFRLAVLTKVSPGENDPSPAVRAERIAHALDLPAAAVGDVGYLARLEYSVTANLDAAPDRPERRVSIVCNHLDDQPVITLKGPDVYEIRASGDLPERIERVRNALEQIATPPLKDVKDPKKWLYGFGYDPPNVGDEARLKRALKELAVLGWQFYDEIVKAPGQKKLAAALQSEQQIIHVAHILLDKVIPWAVLYDRKYDPGRELDDDLKAVAHDVCLAALPDKQGQSPVKECGKAMDCLLHPDRCAARQAQGEPALLPDTVVCPLHFWGFKHIIELPPQQAVVQAQAGQPAGQPKAHEQRTCILTELPLQMTRGVHAHLDLVDGHIEELDTLAGELGLAWKSHASHRDIILKNLKDTGLDVIYFYCHASNQDMAGKTIEPYLAFQDKTQTEPGTINRAALDHDQCWSHYPLVFLNGCRTAGFSPKALSPFIEKFVDGRGAAGVIGTEISVWEPLAGEVARLFLGEFLKGAPAGQALLHTRRVLLAKYNPLGLVYTLYAAANLALDLDGDERCI